MTLGSRLAAARSLVLENFGYKFASLAISVTLFMVFRGAGAVQRSVDVPITEQVYRVLHEGRPIAEALKNLMTRSQKEELWGIR